MHDVRLTCIIAVSVLQGENVTNKPFKNKSSNAGTSNYNLLFLYITRQTFKEIIKNQEDTIWYIVSKCSSESRAKLDRLPQETKFSNMRQDTLNIKFFRKMGKLQNFKTQCKDEMQATSNVSLELLIISCHIEFINLFIFKYKCQI